VASLPMMTKIYQLVGRSKEWSTDFHDYKSDLRGLAERASALDFHVQDGAAGDCAFQAVPDLVLAQAFNTSAFSSNGRGLGLRRSASSARGRPGRWPCLGRAAVLAADGLGVLPGGGADAVEPGK
jgi:hypothetical protein